jgi:hypothetical protein
MDWPRPFDYPRQPHRRRHGPTGYVTYKAYKPWLRDEFTFRCVYCLERETWYPSRSAAFSIDHFEPKIVNPELATDYENLVYACLRCNSVKGVQTHLPDPTMVALGDHVRVDEEGVVHAITSEGGRLIDALHLDVYPATVVRRETLAILRAKQKLPADPDIHQLFLIRFGYPLDLPDLRLCRPGGNAIPGSELSCYAATKERTELPEVY